MFKVVQSGSQLAVRIASALVPVDSRTNYNALAAAFNALNPEANQLTFPWKREKAASLLQQLSERGLTRGTDFSLEFWVEGNVNAEGAPVLGTDGKQVTTENAVITRVNFNATMKITPPHKRGPRKAAAPVAGAAKAGAPSAAKK